MDDAPEGGFEPVNMLERQLIAAANGDAEARKAFERFILDETLLVATPEVHSEEAVTLQQDTQVKLLNVPLNDGRLATAVFTSKERVQAAFGTVGYLGVQGRALFEMIHANPAVLNPGQSYCVIWEPASLAAMIGLPVERVIEKETQVMLGFPKEPPTVLIDRLKAAFAGLAEVRAAWLALAAWPAEKTQTWYLDVRMDGADKTRVRQALGAAIEGVNMDDRPLDMIIQPLDAPPGKGIVVIEPRQLLDNQRKDPASRSGNGWLNRLFGKA